MGDGAANAALSYLFDTTGNKGVSSVGALPGLAGALFSPYEALRDPRRGCGSISPFVPIPGYGPAKGYQYEMPGAGSGNANTPKKFSICDFLLETVIGGITGGLSSAAFYGAGKGIERLMDGLRPGTNTGYLPYPPQNNTTLPMDTDLQFFGKKSDIKQIEQIAKKFKMTPNQRRNFGDYIESLKTHKRNDANFSWKELMKIAEGFKRGE